MPYLILRFRPKFSKQRIPIHRLHSLRDEQTENVSSSVGRSNDGTTRFLRCHTKIQRNQVLLLYFWTNCAVIEARCLRFLVAMIWPGAPPLRQFTRLHFVQKFLNFRVFHSSRADSPWSLFPKSIPKEYRCLFEWRIASLNRLRPSEMSELELKNLASLHASLAALLLPAAVCGRTKHEASPSNTTLLFATTESGTIKSCIDWTKMCSVLSTKV